MLDGWVFNVEVGGAFVSVVHKLLDAGDQEVGEQEKFGEAHN